MTNLRISLTTESTKPMFIMPQKKKSNINFDKKYQQKKKNKTKQSSNEKLRMLITIYCYYKQFDQLRNVLI